MEERIEFALNAMLLNEFLKEHRTVQELKATVARHEKLEATVAQQQKEIQALTAALKTQAAQIQKVTRLRRVEGSKAARVVAKN